MPTRWSKRLAGCLAIEILLAARLPAADFEYRAGAASAGQAQALAIEDRQHHRAVIVQAAFAVTRSVSDFVAARLLRSYEIDRAGLVLRGLSTGDARPEDLFTSVAAALGALEPALVHYGEGAVSITTLDGRCIAAISVDATLSPDRCGPGSLVRGAIRSAFQVVEPAHGLLERDAAVHSYPVQAIAIGKSVTILALGGQVPAARFAARGMIVASFANDTSPLPLDPAIDTAIRQVLTRVK
ncbi:MAG TPA: hypothetical protein VGH38_16910 [Bryobacteraceae bacterium]